jgi:hypothetical protein
MRQSAAKNGYTRDVADFFAHPEKTRGKIRAHARKAVDALRECERIAASGRPIPAEKEPKIEAIPYWAIIKDLNEEPEKLDQLPLQRPVFDAVGLVLMSAMQGSVITYADGETLTLHLASFTDPSRPCVELFGYRPLSVPVPSGVAGIVFPIIGMPNFFNVPEFLLRPDDPGSAMLRVRFEAGNLNVTQECPPIRGQPKQGGNTVNAGGRTVMPGILMVQPLAIKPAEKPTP